MPPCVAGAPPDPQGVSVGQGLPDSRLLTDLPILPDRDFADLFTESARMTRFYMLILAASAAIGSSGCCHYWGSCWGCGSGCGDYYGPGCNGGYGDPSCGRNCAPANRRDCRRGTGDCCPQDCCDPCGAQTMPGTPMSTPITSAYDPAMNMSTGCAGCASGSLTSGLPVTSAGPILSGCATGNCGTTTTYNGMPVDASTGWTIQPSPLNEPLPAPPAGTNTAGTPVTPTSSIVPVPTPVPTPMNSAR